MVEKREIVVLGGNLGGISIAHYLLKYTIPQLERLDKSVSYHITLVTPNTDIFFKIATPRAIINSKLIPQEKIWRPIADGFTKYSNEQFTLVQGLATGLNATARAVTVTSSGASIQSLTYHTLFISTGTTSASPLWTLHHDQTISSNAIALMHEKLPTAKTILVAGGGAVGVETAGELASEYKDAKITLLSGSTRLLGKAYLATAERAESYLKKTQKVEVVHNLRVEKSEVRGDAMVLTLSDGSTRTVDVYIDGTGGVPNSQFLPSSWLDTDKRVETSDASNRVRGDGSVEEAKNVYVIGDIVAKSDASLMALNCHVPVAASSFAVDIAGAGKAPGVLRKLLGSSSSLPVQKAYKQAMPNTFVVPIGREGGVGQIMGYRMPSIMVKMAKGNSYFLEMIDPILTGSKW
ncbi:hypothetical protein BJ878DRAFT_275316 [Calycina marina]|uniref:FAD/NAD(P)-binding domain-containing protein n=1 Tax=Calycina marina TaxID=1763456 RepID=A0A9P7YWS7_9HELO|nr:hypothetical protein BJ878DRAFT_275316 [Calycina marina]